MSPVLLSRHICCCSVTKLCLTPCSQHGVDCSMPGFSVLHCLLEFAQTHIHWVLKSFMWWSFLVTSRSFMRQAETVYKKKKKKVCAWWHIFPLYQNHIYTVLPPATSLEQFLRAIWGTVSLATVLILPQIKFNLQLSHCTFFFFYKLTLRTSICQRQRAPSFISCLWVPLFGAVFHSRLSIEVWGCREGAEERRRFHKHQCIHWVWGGHNEAASCQKLE